MGSTMSCNTCPTAVTSSVVNLSDSVILRVADGVQTPINREPEPPSLEDQVWIEKLQCIDENHSMKTGIGPNELETFIINLEGRLRQGIKEECCFSDLVKQCYRNNPNCPLRCMRESTEFIGSVDERRIQKMKNIVLSEIEKNKGKKSV